MTELARQQQSTEIINEWINEETDGLVEMDECGKSD